jgi:flavin reductase (DIM6/NTAB) family NADH-FMN oxidoreductase RutF
MTDIPWGSKEAHKFVTNVGLITSNGPHGQNIMAAEWTHLISYSPGMIAVCIGPGKATRENIEETKEFGVSITSTAQASMASISGTTTGKETDKITALKELGYKFYNAESIKPMMVNGAALNAECKLVESHQYGTHKMFIGEVIKVSISDNEPLAFHQGQYWKLTTPLDKPSDEERARIKELTEKHKK